MTENARYQAAKACAGEALEALYSVYWADSFDYCQLEQSLAQTILTFTKNAIHLSEPQPPMPEATVSPALEAVIYPGECSSTLPLLPFLVNPVDGEIYGASG
jgi:hypothetical protein